MAWWVVPLGLGALAILTGVFEYPFGWLQWIGVGLVALGLVIAIVRPGDPRRKPGRASNVRRPGSDRRTSDPQFFG